MAEKKSSASAEASPDGTKQDGVTKSPEHENPAGSKKPTEHATPAGSTKSADNAKPVTRPKSPGTQTPVVGTESTEAGPPLGSDEDTLWAALAHLGGVVGVLPSLIIFLVFRHRGTKTRVESKEALNWQITFTIGWLIIEVLVTIVASLIVGAAAGLGGRPGNVLAFVLGLVPVAVWILNIVFSVIGFVTVNRGGSYRYPFAVRLIK